jgi:hypothetical protein
LRDGETERKIEEEKDLKKRRKRGERWQEKEKEMREMVGLGETEKRDSEKKRLKEGSDIV